MHSALNKEGECFMDKLFVSEKQKVATKRLLVSVRVRRLKRVIMLEAQI